MMPKGPLDLVSSYVHSLPAIAFGDRLRDKLTILFNRILHVTYPLNAFWYDLFGRALVDPESLINGYTCKYRTLTFRCPGGNSELQFLNDWEPEVKRLIASLTRGDAIDVGANMGLYSIMLSRCSRDARRILSIEPNPTYFKWLLKNIEVNNCGNIIPQNVAAWRTTTHLRMTPHVFGGPMLDSSVSPVPSSESFVVEARSLDDMCSEFGLNPSVVKVDVEGVEDMVLSGMKTTLQRERPTVIFEALNKDSFDRTCRLLMEIGYGVRQLERENFLAIPC